MARERERESGKYELSAWLDGNNDDDDDDVWYILRKKDDKKSQKYSCFFFFVWSHINLHELFNA